jgi:hypothetical protein
VAFEIADLRVTGPGQDVFSNYGALTRLAVYDHLEALVAVEFVEAARELVVRNVDGAGNVTGGVLSARADVEDERCTIRANPLDELYGSHRLRLIGTLRVSAGGGGQSMRVMRKGSTRFDLQISAGRGA